MFNLGRGLTPNTVKAPHGTGKEQGNEETLALITRGPGQIDINLWSTPMSIMPPPLDICQQL